MDNGPDSGGVFRLLFVCTGNTCRSPMAEAIARRAVERRGWTSVEIRSAGVGAYDGAPASGGALRAAARNGLDIGEHQATYLDAELAEWADLILVMSPSHLMRVVELGAGERASLLSSFAAGEGERGYGIPDPIGGPDEEYLETFNTLAELIEQVFTRIEPVVVS